MANLLLNKLYELLFGGSPLPEPPPYVFPAPTKVDLEYADLAIIDLSKASTEAGRAELTAQVREAMNKQGFFYAVNHGYTPEQTARIFSIANMAFDNVDEKEKDLYAGKSPDVYSGYKPKQTWVIRNDIRDQIEQYNINKSNKQEHPAALRPYSKYLDDFARHNHFNVVYPILKLLARGLELPEDTLIKQHQFDAEGESSIRLLRAHSFPRSKEEEEKTERVWLKGHHDIGCVTVLWSQPIGGLQILSPDGKWRWVKHMDNALVINAGDGLDFLCGGYYPPTRHRVIQPPADQTNCARLGVFYFCFADEDVQLAPHTESPVLQRVGIKSQLKPGTVAPTMRQWRSSRVKSYGHVKLTEGPEKGVEEEVVLGVVVKHYN
ncbi:Clavaminate synthase-like protein [Armillaria gallica]|uniref:Clavaminate synthase-like protein n=1 Tax=Armillaria gallica TaxID=47427 RepID=A0A2H3D642_ARMGA|nr:Clavaminate synthase-like protein [Armillaria gallica]